MLKAHWQSFGGWRDLNFPYSVCLVRSPIVATTAVVVGWFEQDTPLSEEIIRAVPDTFTLTEFSS